MSARQHLRHDDIPGTFVFTGQQCRKGYALNQFCMSLMSAEARTRFKADEAAYMADWALTSEQVRAVLDRDYRAMLDLGGNIFFLLKLGATDGRSTQSIAASIAGQTAEDYGAMMLAGGRPMGALRAAFAVQA